jgi:hypothetical protein
MSWPGSYVSNSRLQTVRCVYKSLFPSSLAFFLGYNTTFENSLLLKIHPASNHEFSLVSLSCNLFPKIVQEELNNLLPGDFSKILHTIVLCGASGSTGLQNGPEKD